MGVGVGGCGKNPSLSKEETKNQKATTTRHTSGDCRLRRHRVCMYKCANACVYMYGLCICVCYTPLMDRDNQHTAERRSDRKSRLATSHTTRAVLKSLREREGERKSGDEGKKAHSLASHKPMLVSTRHQSKSATSTQKAPPL